MKAITIWQPWANLIACGAKKFETRSWKTDYRGPIAIHAAAVKPKIVIGGMFSMDPWDREEKGIFIKSAWQALFPDRTAPKEDYEYLDDIESLPLGKIIATAELVECHKIVQYGGRGLSSKDSGWIETDKGIYEPNQQEIMFGDWTPGRYAWEIANVKMLPEPIPAKGKQGLWNWEEIND